MCVCWGEQEIERKEKKGEEETRDSQFACLRSLGGSVVPVQTLPYGTAECCSGYWWKCAARTKDAAARLSSVIRDNVLRVAVPAGYPVFLLCTLKGERGTDTASPLVVVLVVRVYVGGVVVRGPSSGWRRQDTR